MAIAVTDVPVANYGWMINATSADISDCEELLAAPAAGVRILVEHITINSGAAISIEIGEDEAADDCVTTHIGPVLFAANTSMQWNLGRGGMLITAATPLTCDASGAGAVCIFAWGRYV